MSKKYYYPNRVITDVRLPFLLHITSGLTVYYSHDGKNQLYKADSIFTKKTKFLTISIDDYTITIKGMDKEKNFIYEIKYKGVVIEDPNKKTVIEEEGVSKNDNR